MRVQLSAAVSLLFAGLMASASSHAQHAQGAATLPSNVTSNVPSGSGEASTMTNGVPNLLASNPQPGELGIQTRLTVRKAVARAPSMESDLRSMGSSPATARPTARD